MAGKEQKQKMRTARSIIFRQAGCAGLEAGRAEASSWLQGPHCVAFPLFHTLSGFPSPPYPAAFDLNLRGRFGGLYLEGAGGAHGLLERGVELGLQHGQGRADVLTDLPFIRQHKRAQFR